MSLPLIQEIHPLHLQPFSLSKSRQAARVPILYSVISISTLILTSFPTIPPLQHLQNPTTSSIHPSKPDYHLLKPTNLRFSLPSSPSGSLLFLNISLISSIPYQTIFTSNSLHPTNHTSPPPSKPFTFLKPSPPHSIPSLYTTNLTNDAIPNHLIVINPLLIAFPRKNHNQNLSHESPIMNLSSRSSSRSLYSPQDLSTHQFPISIITHYSFPSSSSRSFPLTLLEIIHPSTHQLSIPKSEIQLSAPCDSLPRFR